MNDDERREAAIAVSRLAVTAWIEIGDDKAVKRLRDALHALSGCRSASRDLRPKRRKAT